VDDDASLDQALLAAVHAAGRRLFEAHCIGQTWDDFEATLILRELAGPRDPRGAPRQP